MLDSVDPDEVRAALARPATTLFVFASKSGSTIEPNSMAAEAFQRIREAGLPAWGSSVVAITDDGTALHQRALAEAYRDVFVNPTDIGGRYSALSLFGMLPAALMGADLDGILADAREMDRACRLPQPDQNPGFALGALMAAGAASGRDKLTLLVPEALASFGLWVEQLVAESTGKQGAGVIPITGEGDAATFGPDRVIVTISVGTSGPDPALLARAEASGAPVAHLTMASPRAIGAEFLRWEVATAAAGLLMGINPFDEPNVKQAKDATNVLLDRYKAQRQLPAAEPRAVVNGTRIAVSHAADSQTTSGVDGCLTRLAHPPDYVSILAYLPPGDEALAAALLDLRAAAARTTGCATMFGYGPRYLHSTGQLHKGGPNTGVFLLITADGAADLPVPGEPFSFGVLEMAQALGDFQSLERAGRRAIHVHLPRRDAAAIGQVSALLLGQSSGV
jgi:glucose-6-phosphate isomerase/transaldolase/glucose-6-phosphate isomerase